MLSSIHDRKYGDREISSKHSFHQPLCWFVSWIFKNVSVFFPTEAALDTMRIVTTAIETISSKIDKHQFSNIDPNNSCKHSWLKRKRMVLIFMSLHTRKIKKIIQKQLITMGLVYAGVVVVFTWCSETHEYLGTMSTSLRFLLCYLMIDTCIVLVLSRFLKLERPTFDVLNRKLNNWAMRMRSWERRSVCRACYIQICYLIAIICCRIAMIQPNSVF